MKTLSSLLLSICFMGVCGTASGQTLRSGLDFTRTCAAELEVIDLRLARCNDDLVNSDSALSELEKEIEELEAELSEAAEREASLNAKLSSCQDELAANDPEPVGYKNVRTLVKAALNAKSDHARRKKLKKALKAIEKNEKSIQPLIEQNLIVLN